MRVIVLFALLLGAAMPAFADGSMWGGERYGPLREPAPLKPLTLLSPTAMHDAIKQGVEAREWKLVDDKPGRMEVKIDNPGRSYWITAAIDYNQQQVRVSYLDSSGLSYHEENGKRMIHPNVPSWLDNLIESINIYLLRAEPVKVQP